MISEDRKRDCWKAGLSAARRILIPEVAEGLDIRVLKIGQALHDHMERPVPPCDLLQTTGDGSPKAFANLARRHTAYDHVGRDIFADGNTRRKDRAVAYGDPGERIASNRAAICAVKMLLALLSTEV